jgi:hypothetical protein
VGLVTIFYCLKFETSLFVASATRRATVEVFDPASTRAGFQINYVSPCYDFSANRMEITTSNRSSVILSLSVAVEMCVSFVATLWFLQVYPLPRMCFSEPLSSNGRLCGASLTAHFRRSSVTPQYYAVGTRTLSPGSFQKLLLRTERLFLKNNDEPSEPTSPATNTN